jgi:hypothetical protein
MPKKYWTVFVALSVIAIAGSVAAQETGKKVIATPTAPNAIGPYSQAIRAGKTTASRVRGEDVRRRWRLFALEFA